MKRITVYCSSSTSLEPRFFDAAEHLGAALARHGLELVYGGGGIGLMGAVARATKKAGGKVRGIITRRLLDLEQGWDGCDELVVVDTMSERKRLMAADGEAFIALPGGLGTFEEFFEVLVQRQVGEHRKPIGLVNLGGYYDPLISLIDHGIEHRFIKPAVHHLLHVDPHPERVLEGLLKAEPFEIDPDRFLPMGKG
ncbi:MAG: hypothetical protein RLZZ558_398 [Planctomycetota bacterium]|jgi:uncharacterized protein (TIGR00730 family)